MAINNDFIQLGDEQLAIVVAALGDNPDLGFSRLSVENLRERLVRCQEDRADHARMIWAPEEPSVCSSPSSGACRKDPCVCRPFNHGGA
jgi:hypothetical protein